MPRLRAQSKVTAVRPGYPDCGNSSLTDPDLPEALAGAARRPPVSVALVTTIRNEQALLRNNILYHRYLGVERVYVFWDETTDCTLETVSDLDYVSIFPSARTPESKQLESIQRLAAQGRTHSDARQCLNMYKAQTMAQKEGLDWLVALDPDELLSLRSAPVQPGCLAEQFARLPTNVNCAHFPPVEVVPRRKRYENVFAEEHLFALPPEMLRTLDGGGFARWISDPYEGERFSVGFLSHRAGKRAIRTSPGRLPTPVSPHGWMGENMRTVVMGRLLHYFCYSAEDFINKFRNYRDRAPTFLTGQPLKRHKALWQRFINDSASDDETIRQYFFDNILLSDLAAEQARNRFPETFVEIQDARQVFRELENSTDSCNEQQR